MNPYTRHDRTRHSHSKSGLHLSDYQDSAKKAPSHSDSKLETESRKISRLLEKLKNDFILFHA